MKNAIVPVAVGAVGQDLALARHQPAALGTGRGACG